MGRRPTNDNIGVNLITILQDNAHGTLAEVDATLASVSVTSLLGTRRIQGIDTTVMGAIYHVVEHFSGHVGQIVMLAKLRLGKDLGLWEIGEDGTARATYGKP